MLEIGEDGRTWLLSGPASSYALGLGEDDELLHLHWGPRIALADAEALAAGPGPEYWAFEATLDGHEEYPVEGGPRFVRPALSVRTEERRGTEWRFEAYEADGDELRLRFSDAGLGITLHYRMRAGTDVVERWVTLANEGPALEVLRADSAAWTLPQRDGWRLSQLHGRWAAESRLVRSELTYGEKVIGSRRGHTSHQHLPWVALDADGAATEERGEVYGCALAWSGTWRIAVAQLPDARVQITGGAGYDDSGLLRLEPGESFVTPVFAGLWSDGGFGGASRAWHAYQRAYVIPDADQHRPVLYNSWEATEFDISEEQQGALARRAAAMGVELFVVDDGWFGTRTSDRAGLGDWTPNPDRFPAGLKPLADEVHALGMQFGIWVEPEMVNPDSELYRAHPDWVQFQPGRKRTELRNQLVLNLAREDVQEYLWEQLDTLLSSAPIDYVKWDFNRCFTDAGWPGEAYPQRLWVDHVHALYRPAGPAAGGPPGCRLRVLLGRRRPDRPRDHGAHGPGVDLGQHRPARPARHPVRLQPGASRADHGRLGHRQPERPAQRPRQLAALPFRECDGRRARCRRRPDPVERGGAGRGADVGGALQGDPARRAGRGPSSAAGCRRAD